MAETFCHCGFGEEYFTFEGNPFVLTVGMSATDVQNQITTRLLRVVKYRGSTHGTNEYPFLIDHQGISVLPITSAGLRHQTSNEPVPTGVQGLDDMLYG